MRTVFPLIAAAMIGASVPASAHTDDAPRSVVVVVAHPDDELFFAPALAGEVRSGSNVHFVFVTSGDAGPGVSGMDKGEALAHAREKEARCSAQALGTNSVEFLRFGDGTLTRSARSGDEATSAMLSAIETAIDNHNPEIVITWGPDGGYGHGDHRMVSALVTQILQAKPADDRPELFYPALVHAPLPDQLASQGWATTAPDLAETRYSYNDADLAATNAATQCHKTQFDAATLQALTPGFHAQVWKGDVAFRSGL